MTAFILVGALGLSVTSAKGQAGWSVDAPSSTADGGLTSIYGDAEAVAKLEASAKASGLIVVDSGKTGRGCRFLLLRRDFDPSKGEKLWEEARGLGLAMGPMLSMRNVR